MYVHQSATLRSFHLLPLGWVAATCFRNSPVKKSKKIDSTCFEVFKDY